MVTEKQSLKYRRETQVMSIYPMLHIVIYSMSIYYMLIIISLGANNHPVEHNISQLKDKKKLRHSVTYSKSHTSKFRP